MKPEVKEAVQKAIEAIRDLYSDAIDIRLEEIEPFGDEWDVVVSFKLPQPTTLAHVLGGEIRLFKIIRISSGEVHSLKVWKS